MPDKDMPDKDMPDKDMSDKSSSGDSMRSTRHVATRPTKKTRPSPAQPTQARPADSRRCTLRVPPFSPEEPELWFAILEGQFVNYNIFDDASKFTQVVTNLHINHAKEVKDLIVNPPERHRYDTIKTELIRRLSASHDKKVNQLLTQEELGDRKPSQFLRHLQDLAGQAVPIDLIRSIWCQRLPVNVQTVLASQPTRPVEQLADLADRILEIVTPCNVAVTSCGPSGPSSEIAELKRMVERLALKVEEKNHVSRPERYRSRRRTPSHYRPGSYQQPRSRTRSRPSDRKHQLCWYHYRFGDEAQKCVKPCQHAGNV